jgi:hypothetical protein
VRAPADLTKITDAKRELSDPREEAIETVAKICHAANKAWCEANGDMSQKDWDQAPTWQKASAIDGVRFHIDNPTATPGASHDNWMALKGREGWNWGPEKDEAKKLHPCMMPFDQLPAEQQIKDRLFSAIVHAIID